MKKPKKSYIPPQLTRHGSMKALTLEAGIQAGDIPSGDTGDIASGIT